MLSVTEKKHFTQYVAHVAFLVKVSCRTIKVLRRHMRWEVFISACGAFSFQHYGIETEGAVI